MTLERASIIRDAKRALIQEVAELQMIVNITKQQLQERLHDQKWISNRVATLVVQELTSPGSLKIHSDQNARLRLDIDEAIAFMAEHFTTQEDGSVHDENHNKNHEQISR